MKKGLLSVIVVALVAFTGTAAYAANTTSTVTVNATVSATAKLALGAATVSFPDTDPDTASVLTASPISIDAKGKTSGGSNITLTVIATDDLKSGGNVIAITNLTWTASGTGFVAGTMSKTDAQSVGSWSGSGAYSGTQTFKLANSWSYATGSYSTTITYTLTAP